MDAIQHQKAKFSWENPVSETREKSPASVTEALSLNIPSNVPIPRGEAPSAAISVEHRMAVTPAPAKEIQATKAVSREEDSYQKPPISEGRLLLGLLHGALMVGNAVIAAGYFSSGNLGRGWLYVGLAAAWGLCTAINLMLVREPD